MITIIKSSEPTLKQKVTRDGQKAIEVTIPDQMSYSLSIKHHRVILYQGNQKDIYGHSNGPIVTSIKQSILAKEDLTIDNEQDQNQSFNDISQNETFSIQLSPKRNGSRKATISIKQQNQNSNQIDFHSIRQSINRIGYTDSIHVSILKDSSSSPSSVGSSSSSTNTDNDKKITKIVSNTLGELYKSYLNQQQDYQKSSSVIIEKKTFKKDLFTRVWREKGKGGLIVYPDQNTTREQDRFTFGRQDRNQIESEFDGEDEETYEEIIVPTLLDSPPPYSE